MIAVSRLFGVPVVQVGEDTVANGEVVRIEILFGSGGFCHGGEVYPSKACGGSIDLDFLESRIWS